MTKNFNQLMSANQIIHAYKDGSVPNAYCYLWNHEQSVELLISDDNKHILTEEERRIALDGIKSI